MNRNCDCDLSYSLNFFPSDDQLLQILIFACYIQNVDPDRPKNDKATILADTVQVLKDLTTEVNRLKAECAGLTEESHEVRFFLCYLKVVKPIVCFYKLSFFTSYS